MEDNLLYCDLCGKGCEGSCKVVPLRINWDDVAKITSEKMYVCNDCTERVDKKYRISETVNSKNFDLEYFKAMVETFMESQEEVHEKPQKELRKENNEPTMLREGDKK
ncbi:hypothetical protein HWB07_gp027 [Bacillus phage vB_BsuM-Goe3]|uniref:Uncharacterized protein n=1 Tax=Bacillus phage vB_BsuM-Goe3 TaxID=1933063 RepID=A0A217EQZ6_BPGO3|nr:hypothetical protein HWB07_gp027 [Bacillus phage vB_BsuM-Goe3]APZ82493.1 hypothetical protein Goe3_c02700 [Bacillus phage vB_BsuM-Goe3]